MSASIDLAMTTGGGGWRPVSTVDLLKSIVIDRSEVQILSGRTHYFNTRQTHDRRSAENSPLHKCMPISVCNVGVCFEKYSVG